jgi:hypothetical protein
MVYPGNVSSNISLGATLFPSLVRVTEASTFPAALYCNPIVYIWRTMDETDAFGLTVSKEANRVNIHETDFIQIQNHRCSASLDLRFQFLDKLGSHSSDQPDLSTRSIGNLVDSERHP